MKFTRPVLITKLKATGVHLSLSLVVFAYLTYKILYDWYPEPYFSVDGGWQGIRLVGAADLMLGPLITFLIFDLRKSRREIAFDLFTIAVIQFGALAYGVHATYSQRPVAVVLIDEFVVSAIEEHYGGQLGSLDELRAYSDEHPPIIYSELPTDRAGLDEVQRIKLEQNIYEHAQMQYYRPRESLAGALEARQALFSDRMIAWNERAGFDAWLRQHGKKPEDVLVAPFSGRYGRVWLVFDRAGEYLDYFRGAVGN